MDKYAVYVVVVYVVTFVLLGAYLAWIWMRLRALRLPDAPRVEAR